MLLVLLLLFCRFLMLILSYACLQARDIVHSNADDVDDEDLELAGAFQKTLDQPALRMKLLLLCNLPH